MLCHHPAVPMDDVKWLNMFMENIGGEPISFENGIVMLRRKLFLLCTIYTHGLEVMLFLLQLLIYCSPQLRFYRSWWSHVAKQRQVAKEHWNVFFPVHYLYIVTLNVINYYCMSAFYGTCNCLSRIIIHTFILEYSYLYKATEMYQADIFGHFVMFLSILVYSNIPSFSFVFAVRNKASEKWCCCK